MFLCPVGERFFALQSLGFACQKLLFVRLEAPLFVPAHARCTRRAEIGSRRAAGPRAAAHSGLDAIEHGARLEAKSGVVAIVSRHSDGIQCSMPGPRPQGDRALTSAERMRRLREKRKAEAADKPPVVIRYRRPKDRRSRPDQWADAINTLMDCLDRYQQWRENLPDSLADSALAERLDAMLEWRDLVDQLSLADPPRGFGRD
jgi:hypothetical protein